MNDTCKVKNSGFSGHFCSGKSDCKGCEIDKNISLKIEEAPKRQTVDILIGATQALSEFKKAVKEATRIACSEINAILYKKKDRTYLRNARQRNLPIHVVKKISPNKFFGNKK